jgi:hypothetical protein
MFGIIYRVMPGAPKWYFPSVGSSISQIHWTRLEKLARGKHSSLFYFFLTKYETK